MPVPYRTMTIIAAFLVNAGLNFALGLLVARFLGPDEFGRYAVAMAVAVVINTAFFEWLRLSTTRFCSDERHASEPGLRATIELGYAVVSLALCAIVGAPWAADVELGMPAALLAAATAAGIGMALFDYRGALARARFLERSYAQIVLFKNAAAFLLMVGGAFLFGSPALVLCGAAASGAAALLVARRALADPQLRPALAQRRHLRIFAIYAMPLVAANVLYQLMPLMNRSACAIGGLCGGGQVLACGGSRPAAVHDARLRARYPAVPDRGADRGGARSRRGGGPDRP